MTPNIETPTAVQAAVATADTARYPRDFAVSGWKQSLGITALISFAFGKSSGERESAFPFNPYYFHKYSVSLRNC